MRAAIYARVSTERQERQQTIDSQLAALRAWAEAQGHSLVAQHAFRDGGYSGSRLDRPGLDGLRDAVRDAAIDVVAVLSPGRLARKYAYQVLLLEEFRRAGCERHRRRRRAQPRPPRPQVRLPGPAPGGVPP